MAALANPPSGARSRKPLPRNVRHTTLASRVGQRVAAKRAAPEVIKNPTPTPGPVAVDLDGQDLIEIPFAEPERPPASLVRKWQLGLLLLVGLAVSLTFKSSLDDLRIETQRLFELGPTTASFGTKHLGLLDALVFDREVPSAPAEPAPVEVELRREGHVSIPGGILVFPSSFRPHSDGKFDLLLHFHGNTAVVKESAEVANLNAAVAIVNLGIGSAPYEECFAVPGSYEDLLATIESGVKRRGLANAELRRVALSGWSAGYGSIGTILQQRRGHDPLDAILILDGIHAGWEDGALNRRQMKPFAEAADRAKRGEIYFGITHSAIDPKAYASTTLTADYLLASVDLSPLARDPVADAPKYLTLESMKGAVSKKHEKTMEPTREGWTGSFHVVGYKGETKEHHMAHLFQMGATLLPDLVKRWDDR